ncbi:MAG: HlyD family efflux transporter periplasmic adaptor subunit [Emcibacter sp.]|nr:HlyD family efflux transporter periplasmic adaptor subunit [Emcibacter sp.]
MTRSLFTQFLLNLTLLILISCLISCDAEQNEPLQGYVEGRLLSLSPRAEGIITALNVEEGDEVNAGTLLFSVDRDRAQAQLDQLIAAKYAAEAQLENLKKGGRKEEINAATEILKAAEAEYTLAQKTYDRSKNLVDGGIKPHATLDQDRARMDKAKAQVTEAKSRLALIRLPARSDVILAAEHEVETHTAAISRAKEDLKDRNIMAPASGRIETIFRRVGEMTGPTQPVLSLLPPDQMRIRFFVPEPMLALIHHGDMVFFQCDNCTMGQKGKITYISNQAEFTPPVIFTKKERAKLVYLVEARPDQPEFFLNGQPVNVILP